MTAALSALWGRQSGDYWARVRLVAQSLKTDGCSGPTLQLYVLACYEHDIHYRTGKTLSGEEISRYDADKLFGHRIRQMAQDGIGWHPRTWWHLIGFPMSAWRFVAVRVAGESSYRGKNPNGHPASDTDTGGLSSVSASVPSTESRQSDNS